MNLCKGLGSLNSLVHFLPDLDSYDDIHDSLLSLLKYSFDFLRPMEDASSHNHVLLTLRYSHI